VRSEGLSILAAVALHVGVLIIAKTMPPLSLLKESDQRELRTIEIELPTTAVQVAEPPPSTDPAAPPDLNRAPDARLAGARAAVPGGPTQTVPAPGETATPDTTNTPPPSTTGTHSQYDDLPPDQRPGVLGVPGVPGLGGPGVWAIPGVLGPDARGSAPAPTVAPAPRQVPRDVGDRVLGDMMATRDKAIGLDLPMAGNMASAVRSSVMGSAIPTGAKASVECSVSPTGAVSNCHVVGFPNAGSAADWRTAAQAAGTIAGGSLPGQYAKGAIVTIDITVLQAPPAGSKGGFNPTGATFDISNIGAHTTRQVKISHRVVALR
jgi:hypothetical protein